MLRSAVVAAARHELDDDEPSSDRCALLSDGAGCGAAADARNDSHLLDHRRSQHLEEAHCCGQRSLLVGVLGCVSLLLTAVLLLSARFTHRSDSCDEAASASSVQTDSFLVRAGAWRAPVSTPQHASKSSRPQSHTAVCINFNWPPLAETLATVVKLQSRLHRHLTIVAPVSLSSLPLLLPSSVQYIECVPESIVRGERPVLVTDPRVIGVGIGGELQHFCTAACFERYASTPGLRGVLWQADDMFVNYTQLFSDAAHFPPSQCWSPGSVEDQLLWKPEAISKVDSFWNNHIVGNAYLLRGSLELIQREERWRRAWARAYATLDTGSGVGVADLLYVPSSQLQPFIDLVQLLSHAPEPYVTVPDNRPERLVQHNGSVSRPSVEVRSGMSFCEWLMPTLLRLTAAASSLEHEHSAELPITYPKAAWQYVWGDQARSNATLLRQLVFHEARVWGTLAAAVHPLKLSQPDQRRLYSDAYQQILRQMQAADTQRDAETRPAPS